MSLGLTLVLLLAVATGCSEADKRKWKRTTPEQNYATALESRNADQRRDAVVRIGESGYYASENAFHVLDAVARTDAAPQIRCIAIRVLARYDDERPVAPLMAVLNAGGPGGQALPADDDVRWEAARALVTLDGKGMFTPEQRESACEMFIQMLRNDRSRNVRIVAGQALAGYKDRRVLTPLVNALRNEDFMIADTAERSLMALTGTTHDYDADAWSRWIDQTPEPFANAGKPVATSRPAGPSWWDKQQRVWRKAIKLGAE
jgi:HEAT repeat protein